MDGHRRSPNMLLYRTRPAMALALSVFLVAFAIIAPSSDVEAQDTNEGLEGANTQERTKTFDAILLEIAEQIRGYAGHYLSDGGKALNIWLMPGTSSRQAEQAQQVLAERFDDQEIANASLRSMHAEYSWQELYSWHPRVWETSVELVASDIHDGLNRLQVGMVDPDRDREKFFAEVEALGVPRDAIRVVQRELAEAASSLQGRHRPLRAGLRIRRVNGGACTMGPVGIRNGEVGFMTNSHCTQAMSVVHRDRFGQHDTAAANLVGTEVVDPSWFNRTQVSSCPQDRWCRYADVVWVRTDAQETNTTNGIWRGSIAWPAGGNVGSVSWDGTSERRIISTDMAQPSPGSGSFLAKVGATTGISLGTVPTDGGCHNMRHAGMRSDEVLLCQWSTDIQQGTMGGGDSGSPVFRRDSGNANDAGLRGIAHSTTSNIWGTPVRMHYSPMYLVKDGRELGSNMSLCGLGISC